MPPGMGLPPGQTVNVPPPPPAGGAPGAGSVVDVPPPPPGARGQRCSPARPPARPPPPPPPRRRAAGPPGGYAAAPRAAADGNPFASVSVSGTGSVSVMSASTAKSLAERAASAIQRTLGLVGAAGADPSMYPGMPPGWGAGMSAAQLQAAYHQHTRQSRRLYVGNIPRVTPPVSADAITAFFNDAMIASGAAVNPAAGDPVVTTTLNAEKGFAFVEFLAMEDAESALMFNDVPFQSGKLAVRRRRTTTQR